MPKFSSSERTFLQICNYTSIGVCKLSYWSIVTLLLEQHTSPTGALEHFSRRILNFLKEKSKVMCEMSEPLAVASASCVEGEFESGDDMLDVVIILISADNSNDVEAWRH